MPTTLRGPHGSPSIRASTLRFRAFNARSPLVRTTPATSSSSSPPSSSPVDQPTPPRTHAISQANPASLALAASCSSKQWHQQRRRVTALSSPDPERSLHRSMKKPGYLRSSGSFKKLLLSFGHRVAPTKSALSPDDDKAPDSPPSPDSPAWRCFSYNEIHRATEGFRAGNLVGQGGSSEVYRGALPDGRAVAVKRLLGAAACERRERDFLAELGTVGHARHPNVCPLLGCCVDRDLYLVFAFSARGSVSACLHDGDGEAAMGWEARYGVAVGTARGLEYLHKGCRRRIIHRDIKASNVLLTDDLQPQISDFGLAKWLPTEWTHRAIAPIEGTFGCLAPEYYTHGIVDEKTDVFAFGVFLLEVMAGRKPVDGTHRSLLSWARPLLNEGKTEALVDPRLAGGYDAEQARRLAFVASLCIRASAAWRPSMTEVLELLEGVEVPQDDDRWAMPEAEARDDDGEEPWDFDDLDDDYNDDEEFCTLSPSSTISTSST